MESKFVEKRRGCVEKWRKTQLAGTIWRKLSKNRRLPLLFVVNELVSTNPLSRFSNSNELVGVNSIRPVVIGLLSSDHYRDDFPFPSNPNSPSVVGRIPNCSSKTT